MRRRALRSFVLIFLGLAPVPVSGEGPPGELSGRVAGADSRGVANLCITAVGLGNGARASAKTDGDGRFTLGQVLPGEYRVELGCEGPVKQAVKLAIAPGEHKQIALTLKAVYKGDADAAVSSGMKDAKSVSDLPSNGRDLTEVATLQAGVSSVKTQPDAGNIDSGRGQRGFGAQISISGSRPQQNNYILNGISINDYANSAPGSVLGLDLGADAVEQFTVSTSSYPAEYGRSSGGIVNVVTRSGGDRFHGAAYEFLRNSALDARNYFDGAKPPFRRNQFGVSAGSPMWAQRLQAFSNYEGLRQSLGVTHFNIVPSLAARSGQLASGAVTVDPQAARYLAFFPLPNRGLIGNGDTGNYAVAGQQVTPENYFTARIDAKLGDADTVTLAYVLDDSKTTQPDQFDLRINEITTSRQLISLAEAHRLTQRLTNSSHFGISRVVAELGLTPTALNPIAADRSYGFLPGRTSGNLNISGLTNFTGGLGAASPYHFHWTSIQFYDDVSYTKGRNVLHAGVALERMRDNILSNADPNGIFTFNSLAEFLTNRPYLLTIAIPGTSTPRDMLQTLFAAYAQDDARLTDRLTTYAGLRYEMATVPTEAGGKLAALRNIGDASPHVGDPYFANPTLTNFEPRLGIAWNPRGDGRLMVRSGLALFDVLPLPYEFELLSSNVAPFFESGTPNNLPPLSFPYGAVQLAQSPTSLRYAYIEPQPRRSYVAAWNLNLQLQPAKSISVLIGYVGSRGIHQPFRVDDSNLVLPARTAQGYVWPLPIGSGTKINPTAGRVDALMWRGDSIFHGLQTQVQAKVRSALDLQVAYTWSKSLDTGSATIAGDQFANSISSLPWYDLRRNWGRSDFDVAQNVSAHMTYQLPGPTKESRDWLLKGWRLIGTYQASGGSPFTPTIAGDPLGTRSSDPLDVPNRVVSRGCAKPVNRGRPLAYIRQECFTFPAQVNVMGNLGRNSVLGPGLWTLDSSLFKETPLKRISSTFTSQLRVEVFNVLNRSNFAAPLDHRAIFNAAGAPINGAGQIDTTTTPSRQMQLGLKLLW